MVGRRTATAVAGLVLAAGMTAAGTAFAQGAPELGCPVGYTLDGSICRNGTATAPGLPILPGDMDPGSGEVLVPADPTTPSSTTVPPTTTTTTTETVPPTTTTTTTETVPPTTTTTTETVPPTTTTTTTVLPPTTTTTTATVPPTTTTTTVPPATSSQQVPAPPSSTVLPPPVVPPAPTVTPAPPVSCPAPGTALADAQRATRTRAAMDAARGQLVADVRAGAPRAVIAADRQALLDALRAHGQALATQRINIAVAASPLCAAPR